MDNARKQLTEAQRIALQDFQAANPRILTPADYWIAAEEAAIRAVAKDAERLDWLQEQAMESRNGASFDYAKHAEDGVVLERGFRFMRRFYLGDRKPSLREAIDSARWALTGAQP